MCYDISFKSNIKTIEDDFPGILVDPQIEFGFHDIDHLQAHSNFSYSCIVNEVGNLSIEHMFWAGILNQRRERVYNARSETVLDKKSLWYRLRANRGLVPVTGIYEHRAVPGLRNKVPYYISIANRPVFYLPCLYDDGNIVDNITNSIPRTFTLLTRRGNKAMQQIHNADPDDPRMVLFLTPELECEWLSENLSEERMKAILNYEMDSKDLAYHTVFTIRSNKLRPDGMDKTGFFEWGAKVPQIII